MYRLFNTVKICLIVIFLFSFSKCKSVTDETAKSETSDTITFSLPDWAKNAVIYEVNIRQYTPEGTFNAFAKHLDRLDNMGVDILWLMPIYPISKTKRKATNELFVDQIEDLKERDKYLGSPYSVADYTGINPDLGSATDFRNLVNQIHARGMKIILDYVPNHTGWDHTWINDHPDWYTQDNEGNIIDPIDPGTGKSWGWVDVADLNYDIQAMRDEQVQSFLYWVKEMDVDGFRQDVAHNVPLSFWKQASSALLAAKPDIFLLAEAEVEGLRNDKLFHADYGWGFHHLMNDIAKGHKNASDIDLWYTNNRKQYNKGFHIHFTSNHDENTWAGTVFDRMGDAHKALAILAATFDGMPLLYGGQEEPLRHRLSFFEKDDIGFSEYDYSSFYKTLFDLKDHNEALWNGTYGGPLTKISDSKEVYAFRREKNGDKVVVIINLTNDTQNVKLTIDDTLNDVFSNKSISFKNGQSISLDPWEYIVASN